MRGKSCAVCGRAMTVHRQVAGSTCDNARCKHEQLKRELRARHLRDRAIREQLEGIRDRASRVVRLAGTEPLPLAVLPSNDRRVVNLPEKRRRAFRDYLTRSIGEAAAALYSGAKPESDDAGERTKGQRPGEAETAVMGHGCATCRGHCCEEGGEHGFLNREQMRRRLARDRRLRPRELLEFYLSRLPNRSYADSCVFHGEHGCVMAREERSSLCNDFLCRGLSALWHGVASSGSHRAFAGAVSGTRVMRAAVIDERRMRPVELSETTRRTR